MPSQDFLDPCHPDFLYPCHPEEALAALARPAPPRIYAFRSFALHLGTAAPGPGSPARPVLACWGGRLSRRAPARLPNQLLPIAASALATTPSCSGNTVLRSSTTLPSSTRPTIGGSHPRNRPANSSALMPSHVTARTRVGREAAGAAPPPTTDVPSTVSSLSRPAPASSFFLIASARFSISSAFSPSMRTAGMSR